MSISFKTYNIKYFINLLFLIVLLFSVNRTHANNIAKSHFQKDTVTSADAVFTYPTPDELIKIIEIENVSFYSKYLNPVENESKYINSKLKNLNLGVYIADLSYASFFEKRSKILHLIENITKLSDELIISSETKINLKSDLEKNIENLDSIYRLTSKYYTIIMQELEQNNNNHNMVIISTGAYIESIYLSLNLIEKYSADNDIIKKIAEQKNAFINLNHVSNLYIEKPYISEIINYQEQVLNLFNQFKVENKGKMIFTKNPDGTVKFKTAEKITMNEEQFYKLKETVIKLRNEITKN